MININKPFLPPMEEYQEYLKLVWGANCLTNNGPLVKELELKLSDFLNVKNLLYVTNGTIAIQLAIKALELKGEIITTPYSYVATSSSIVWEGCTPVFADVDPKTLLISPEDIERKITPTTTGIIATHLFGNVCDIEAIQGIALKYNLKVIYDAAHCFGTKYKGRSVFEYGDISTTSFHATKLFHTAEGGAVITNNPDLHRKLSFLRNFGHNGPDYFEMIGINGKNSELHAAMGLSILPYVNYILDKRRKDSEKYNEYLQELNILKPHISDEVEYNYAYYPIIFKNEEECLRVYTALQNENIFARRYFYPLLTQLNYVDKQESPVAEEIAKRTLCLPIFEQITVSEIERICQIIIDTFKNNFQE